MSKSRPFSIYLLKQGYSPTSALEDKHGLDGKTDASRLPEDASLFVLDNHPNEPWWKEYFGIEKPLSQVSKGALIFLPVNDRYFVLSFGHVYHKLKNECYEYDFGLRVTLNSLDPEKLKSTDILEPGAARRQRTQMPMDSDLTFFDFDRDSTILKSLTGKVKDAYKGIIRHATGASSLQISSAVSPEKLPGLCEKLLTLYESSEYRDTFPDIQNILPVRDPKETDKLNANLLKAFQSKNENLYLTIPNIVDYAENVYASFSGAGVSLAYDDVFIGRYYDYLEKRNVALKAIDISDLKKHRLILTDEAGADRNKYQLFNCLIYDTANGPENKTYHLNEGNWYKVEDDYIAKLKEYLDPFCKDLGLPNFNHENEGAYNEGVAKKDCEFLCMDRKNISPKGQSQIEPCDLFSVKDGRSIFIHVKRSTVSAQLSHLFNQGANSIELLKLESEPVVKLNKLIQDLTTTGNKAIFNKPVDIEKLHVIFAIITHKDKIEKSKNLPLFSRISLRRVMKELQLMSVKAHYGFVSDKTPKKKGKKKTKKVKCS